MGGERVSSLNSFYFRRSANTLTCALKIARSSGVWSVEGRSEVTGEKERGGSEGDWEENTLFYSEYLISVDQRIPHNKLQYKIA